MIRLLTLFLTIFYVVGMVPLLSHPVPTARRHFTTASSPTSPLLLSSGVPRGSGPGPASFLTYSEGTTDISTHSLLCHLYADDTQTCGHCSTSDILALIRRLALLAFYIGNLA